MSVFHNLKKELELEDDIYPILGLAIGYENPSCEKITDSEKLKFVEDELINKINFAIKNGYKNIILEAGTGIGKSAIATTLDT